MSGPRRIDLRGMATQSHVVAVAAEAGSGRSLLEGVVHHLASRLRKSCLCNPLDEVGGVCEIRLEGVRPVSERGKSLA